MEEFVVMIVIPGVKAANPADAVTQVAGRVAQRSRGGRAATAARTVAELPTAEALLNPEDG